eukprot:CAMPEP_0173455128 /NCGR_PEP_ID=MMETSP1357-20121228/53715_1 /TAXON_ID=77926 /ORGANISM="Hemiselmis rufescens, Strain PCC563" /LENGTH=206 /DNA_ID=CAMNT_0014422227 /DNA_START=57 /DNA_END=673 /DNA_ORIENTATION=-
MTSYTVALFSVALLCNAFMWITFAPIAAEASSFFFPAAEGGADGGEAGMIDLLSLTYLVLYLPGTMMASFVVGRSGLRAAVILGASLTALGAGIRYLSVAFWPLGGVASYSVCMGGQCLAALAQPVFVNCPGKLAAHWFGLGERDAALTITTLFTIVGQAVGQVLPPAFVSRSPGGEVLGMGLLMLSELLLSALSLLLVCAWFRSA